MLAADWLLDLTLEAYITTPILVVCFVAMRSDSWHMQLGVDKIILKCQWFVQGTFSSLFFVEGG